MAKITKAVEVNRDHIYFDPQYLDDCGGKMQYDMPKLASSNMIKVFENHSVTIYGTVSTVAANRKCLVVIGFPGIDYAVSAVTNVPDLSVMIGKKSGVPIVKYSF